MWCKWKVNCVYSLSGSDYAIRACCHYVWNHQSPYTLVLVTGCSCMLSWWCFHLTMCSKSVKFLVCKDSPHGVITVPWTQWKVTLSFIGRQCPRVMFLPCMYCDIICLVLVHCSSTYLPIHMGVYTHTSHSSSCSRVVHLFSWDKWSG